MGGIVGVPGSVVVLVSDGRVVWNGGGLSCLSDRHGIPRYMQHFFFFGPGLVSLFTCT